MSSILYPPISKSNLRINRPLNQNPQNIIIYEYYNSSSKIPDKLHNLNTNKRRNEPNINILNKSSDNINNTISKNKSF